jgi:hypothetical protein
MSVARQGPIKPGYFVERFYNARRRPSTIDYLSPMEFKRRAGFA